MAIVKDPNFTNVGIISEMKGEESEVLFKPTEEEHAPDDTVSFGDWATLIPMLPDEGKPPKPRSGKENVAPKRRLKVE